MAEAILLSALLPLVFEKSADLIGKQLGKILGADVERELGKLQSTLTTIRAVLQDAEQKQVTNEALRHWLSNLKLAAYDADDLLDDFNLPSPRRRPETRARKLWRKVRDFFTSRNPLVFRTSMSSRIKDVVERIDSLAAERTRFGLTPDGGDSVERLLASRPQTHSYVPELDVVGRGEDVIKIVGMVIAQEHEKNVSVLPILGMGGLGKTTLAQMVFNEPTVKEHFELQMWLSVTHDFSAAKIAKAMIETATDSGFSLSDMDSLQRSLRQVIGAKRYLLVLDDVWNEDPMKWEELKVLLTFGAQGSVVIVTTRSGIASALMGTLDIYRLAELSEDDCWILFKQKAFVERAEERPNLVAIGRAIVNKCGGLPLAAKALGNMMRLKGDDERKWKSVMESEIWNLPEGKSGILPALRLSYFHLPSHLKQCFAFCAIFPRSYEIEKEMLVKLWMANGFIPCKDEMELEFEGNRIFEELEQRSFFQDVKEVKRWYDGNSITTCRMHDLIHDLARSIMGNECCILDELKLDDISKTKYRHLLINYEGKPARVSRAASFSKGKRTRSQTLRTLLLRNNQHGPPKSAGNPPISWSDTKYLRVLSLHNIGMTEFPISICNLRHLRYLDLSHNDIQTLPEAISNIFSLQTLNLSACGLLLRLPESLKHMSSLMHLYLEGCKSLTCMPKGMGQLRYLQTLTRYTAGSRDGSGSIAELRDLNLQGMLELHNLKNVENVADAEEANLGSKENLRQIDLDWGESDVELRARITEEVLQALQPHQNLKQLTICHYQGIKFPTWLSEDSMLLTNLVEITLSDCSKCEHLPQLWQLPALQILEMKNMKSFKDMGGSEFNGTTGVVQDRKIFPSLRILKLYDIPNLEEWSGVDEESFPKIVEIEIFDCPNLMTMPALPSAQVLQIRNCPLLRPANGFFRGMKSLEKLDIDSCDKMTLLLEQEDETEISLRYLQIKNCEQLMFLSPSLGLWKYFNSLHNLEIKSCNGLVMFPIDVMHGLTSLRRLVIHCCYHLMGTSEEEEGLQFQGLPSLEELDIQVCVSFPCFHPEGLRQLTVLKKLLIYSNHGLTTLPQFPECVRDVTIYNCWNLVSLPEGLGLLPALERFVIISLRKVSSLPEEMQGYKALKSLKIEDCPRVISLPEGIQQRLPSLKYLDIKGCPELEKRCMAGGEYWSLVSCIPVRYIGGS